MGRPVRSAALRVHQGFSTVSLRRRHHAPSSRDGRRRRQAPQAPASTGKWRTLMEHRYVTDLSPGRGRLAPRAAFGTDVPAIELDGGWRFRLAAGLADVTEGFETPAFD